MLLQAPSWVRRRAYTWVASAAEAYWEMRCRTEAPVAASLRCTCACGVGRSGAATKHRGADESWVTVGSVFCSDHWPSPSASSCEAETSRSTSAEVLAEFVAVGRLGAVHPDEEPGDQRDDEDDGCGGDQDRATPPERDARRARPGLGGSTGGTSAGVVTAGSGAACGAGTRVGRGSYDGVAGGRPTGVGSGVGTSVGSGRQRRCCRGRGDRGLWCDGGRRRDDGHRASRCWQARRPGRSAGGSARACPRPRRRRRDASRHGGRPGHRRPGPRSGPGPGRWPAAEQRTRAAGHRSSRRQDGCPEPRSGLRVRER